MHAVFKSLSHFFVYKSIPTGKYYIATMTMITASTALTIFIMNIHHCGPEAKPVPRWAKKFILQYMARICFVFEVGENCMMPQPERPEPPQEKSTTDCRMNGQAGRESILRVERAQDEMSQKILEENEDTEQVLSPSGSMGRNPTNHFTAWRNGVFMSMDCGDSSEGAPRRVRRNELGSERGGGKETQAKGQCMYEQQELQRNIEYIANCYRDQRATQRRTGEWKKVAKVLDRFFMWMFFIMVFLMSLLIMGKAI